MRKMRLDLDGLDVQSFQTLGSGSMHGVEMSHGTCPKDCDSRTGCSCQGCGSVKAHAALATDPPICPTGPGCTVPDTLEPNRTCTCG